MTGTQPDRQEPPAQAAAAATRRYRRFHVASVTLTRDVVEVALDRPNVARYVAVIHDKDPDVPAHGHVVFEMAEARSVQMVANMLGVSPRCVRPLVGQRGDRYSFGRAVRRLTHESLADQAKGKHRYDDSDVFSSAGYRWRAEVNDLRWREEGGPSLAGRLKLQVLLGERTARSVMEEFPELYIEHHEEFENLERRFLLEQATPAIRALRAAEARRRAREGG